MDPFFHTGLSISDSLKTVRKSVLIYETIIKLPSETVNETVADGSMYRYLIRYLREPQGV